MQMRFEARIVAVARVNIFITALSSFSKEEPTKRGETEREREY